ncbi:hypothetical protein DNU06_00060 [Putridiphycobacter roseus]|uniref:Uncharacterized protein n=1 Tax=Putridiphycobacter roseus TaxID=2219161 RepID=A0A2W1N314_9FLAO|nr:PD40 domain-containing protein [Putridiphycobacter roseus]PZE18264.1 hypothetical protein DNU06_00060 [Putridiphycobacter roseus]
MKHTLFLLFLSLSSLVYAFESTPPDSTLSILKKAEIKILISDGRTFYNEDRYRLGLLKFREALSINKNHANANYWVAESHLALGNYGTALKYAKIAESNDPNANKDLQYVIGQSNHRLGNFDAAIKAYEMSLLTMPKSRIKGLLVDKKISECKRGLEMIKTPLDVTIKPLGATVNSRHDDYAAFLSNDGQQLYYSSRKAQNTGGGKSAGDSKYFSDILISDWDATSKDWTTGKNLDPRIVKLNSQGFDDMAGFSADGAVLYLTINTEGLLNEKINTQSTDIYYSTLNKEKNWASPKPFDRSLNTFYFEASPTFTEDGNTMYFISERIGGEGKADIWTSKKVADVWQKAENLGNTINTAQQETTVFVSGDNKYLFFSSEGHEGMGGYDIYVSKKVGENWSTPINIGFPINDVSDETHFVFYPKLKKAYYSKLSTDNNGGLGGRDIFEVNLTTEAIEKIFSSL